MTTTGTPATAATGTAYTRSRTWHNFSEGEYATPLYTVTPRSEAAVVEAVRLARRENLTLRVAGGGFSFSPVVPTGGVLVEMGELRGITGVDTARSRVRVLPGTRIYELGDLLWAHGLAVSVQGMFDWQTIAGVVSTGTHGTGLQLPCMSAFVTWMRIVDGRGEVVEIGEEQLDDLRAAQLSLGMLGIVVELELQVQPRFLLEKVPDHPSWSQAMSTVDRDLQDNRHYGLMWFPHAESAELYRMPIPEEAQQPDLCWRLAYRQVDGDPDAELAREWGQSVGRSYHIFSVKKDSYRKFQEMEYSVPFEVWKDAAESLRALMRRSPDPLFPLWIRWVGRDSAFISPFSERDAVTLSVAGEPGGDYWGFFEDYHALLRDFEARPHWGKIHMFGREDIERVFPGHADFVRIRAAYDPDGMFLNDHLRPLFS